MQPRFSRHPICNRTVTTAGVIRFVEAYTGKIDCVRSVDRNGGKCVNVERRDEKAFIKVPYSENIG